MPFKVTQSPVKPASKTTYPILAQAKQAGYKHTVLFLNKTSALVIDAGDSTYYKNRIGQVVDFVSHEDIECWDILPKGTIVTYTQG